MTNNFSNAVRAAQSASALGAGILGFGIGSKVGFAVGNYALVIITIGGIFHVWGMYLTQMKNYSARRNAVAKALWISAWICLIALIGLILYWAIKS